MSPAIPPSARARGRIAPAKMAHVVLRTNRYEEAVAWWKTLLELEPLATSPFMTFMTFDDEHHRLAIIRGGPELKDKLHNSAGVDHFAFSYASVGELLSTYERLAARGIRPTTSIHHGITLSFYYLDPDRNQVELQVDAFRSVAATNAYLESSFVTNPIGVLFDGDALVKRWREGASDAELLRPLEGGPPDMRTAFAEH